MTRFGRLKGEFAGISQDTQNFTKGDEAMVSQVEFVIRQGEMKYRGTIGVRQRPEVRIQQAILEVGGLEYPVNAPWFEYDGFRAQAEAYYRRLIGVHGTEVRSGMSIAGVRMEHHYLTERLAFEVEAAEPSSGAGTGSVFPTWDARFGPRVPNDPRLELKEIRWRMRGGDGKVLQCSIYQVGTGLELRSAYGSQLVRSKRCPDVDTARALAVDWRKVTLARGFEELV